MTTAAANLPVPPPFFEGGELDVRPATGLPVCVRSPAGSPERNARAVRLRRKGAQRRANAGVGGRENLGGG